MSKKGRDFFKWTCADAPAGTIGQSHPRWRGIHRPRRSRGAHDGDVPVHGYRSFVREQGQYHGPVETDIARATGLPTRFAMSEPSMGASMVMHYSDYERPATIEFPACLSQ